MAQILKTLSRCFITFETEQQYVDTYKKDLIDTYYQMYSTKDAPCKMAEDMLRLEYQRQKLLKSERYWKDWWARTFAFAASLVVGFVVLVILS